MANVLFKFAAPPGYTLEDCDAFRSDTLALLDTATAVETSVPGWYSVTFDVGSYAGDVIVTVPDFDGTLFGSTSGDLTLRGEKPPGDSLLLQAIYTKTQLIGVGSPAFLVDRLRGSSFTLYSGEQHSFRIPTADYSARAIDLVFWDQSNNAVATFVDSELDKDANSVGFSVESITVSVRTLKWSIRDASDAEVLAFGKASILDQPIKSS